MHKSSRAGPLPSDWQIWCNHLHTIISRVRFLPLSWGELSFSRELDRNHPYHHRDHRLFGRNGEWPKKNPSQARSRSSLDHVTLWLLPHGHEHHGSDSSSRKVTSAARWGAELPGCWPCGWCPWGGTHLLIPAQAPQQCGAPCRSVHNRNRNCRAVLTARTYLFACTQLWACNTNSCSLPHRKTGDCSTK